MQPAVTLRAIVAALEKLPGALGVDPADHERLVAFLRSSNNSEPDAVLIDAVVALSRSVATEQRRTIRLETTAPLSSSVLQMLSALAVEGGVALEWEAAVDSVVASIVEQPSDRPTAIEVHAQSAPNVWRSDATSKMYISRVVNRAAVLACVAVGLVQVLPLATLDSKERGRGSNHGKQEDILLRVRQNDRVAWQRVAVSDADFANGKEMLVHSSMINTPELPPHDLEHISERHGRAGWLGYQRIRKDSAEDLDLVLHSSVATTVLTDSPSDDVAPSFVGGGDSIVFLSRRMSENGNTDVWLTTVRGGSASRLTRTSTNEYRPHSNETGSKIAYLRAFAMPDSMFVCTISLAELRERCRMVFGLASESNIHWLGDTALLVDQQGAMAGRLIQLDTLLNERRTVHEGGVGYMPSMSSRYISHVTRSDEPELRVFRLEDPERSLRIAEWRGHGAEIIWRVHPVDESAKRASLRAARVQVTVGDTLRLEPPGLASLTQHVDYQVSDSSVVQIVDSGRLIAMRPGTSMVRILKNGVVMQAQTVAVRDKGKGNTTVWDISDPSTVVIQSASEGGKLPKRIAHNRAILAEDSSVASYVLSLGNTPGMGAIGADVRFTLVSKRPGIVSVGIAISSERVMNADPAAHARHANVSSCTVAKTNSDAHSLTGWEYRFSAGSVGVRREAQPLNAVRLALTLDDEGRCIGYDGNWQIFSGQGAGTARRIAKVHVWVQTHGGRVLIDSLRTHQISM